LYFDPIRRDLVQSSGWYKISKTQWLHINDQLSVIKDTLTEPMPKEVFGESICPLDAERFIELTWQDKKVYILDRRTLKRIETRDMWPQVKEGWGMTHDEERKIIYISEGTDKIILINSQTLEYIDEFKVKHYDGKGVSGLNELQFVRGKIWANVFGFDYIIRIDAVSG
jgi:glutaminyl-peptide cyclotransferase